MQLTVLKEDAMRAQALLAPAAAVEKHYLELDEEQLIGSVEITEEEILDDLLFPADHRAASSGGSESHPDNP
jgi:hypothetical protein